MNIRSVVAITLGALLALPMLAWGQDAKPDRPRREERRQGDRQDPGRLEQLRLAVLRLATEDQKKQIEELFALAQAKIEALRKEAETDRTKRRQLMDKLVQIQQELRDDLGKVLTPEQREKLRQLGERRADRDPLGLLGERLQENLDKLQLSDEQKEKIGKLREEMGEKVRKLREEARQDREQMRQRMPELVQEMRTKLMEILTPDQQKTLRDAMREGGERPRERGQRPERPARERAR